jgi:mRNA interferase HigB
MILAGRNVLDAFKEKHPAVRKWVNGWVAEVERAVWKTSQDIKARYQRASFLGFNMVIFDVQGNAFRVVTQVLYATDEAPGTVRVKWTGTHAEYSKKDFE